MIDTPAKAVSAQQLHTRDDNRPILGWYSTPDPKADVLWSHEIVIHEIARVNPTVYLVYKVKETGNIVAVSQVPY